MKTLKAKKGKYLDLKPCKNCVPRSFPGLVDSQFACPCSNFSGEAHVLKEKGKSRKITLFSCKNQVMHVPPKSNSGGSKKTLTGRSK